MGGKLLRTVTEYLALSSSMNLYHATTRRRNNVLMLNARESERETNVCEEYGCNGSQLIRCVQRNSARSD